jgi:hypothetical protein
MVSALQSNIPLHDHPKLREIGGSSEPPSLGKKIKKKDHSMDRTVILPR